jgi:uncharacterized membrane protein
MYKQNRWTSPVLLASLAVQILSIIVLSGAIDVSQSESINTVVGAVLQLLVAFGVLNNPTDKTSF